MKQELINVVTGQLVSPHRIETETGESVKLQNWKGRAVWSYLRLVRGRHIDDMIKAAGKAEKKKYLRYLLENSEQTKPLQFILSSGNVHAVATTNHLLVNPQEVIELGEKYLKAAKLDFATDPNLKGIVTTTETKNGLNYGFHLYPGDILTRRAISVSAYVQTIVCLNPLTWAGIGNFGRFGLAPQHDRILRIQRKEELQPRLEAAIKSAAGEVSALKKMVEYAKTNNVNPKEARIILAAFSKSYGLGDKSTKDLLERFESEDQTTYGMSQAASWVAQHGEEFRAVPKGQDTRARQSMSVIGAASLLLKKPSVTVEKARKWLGERYGNTDNIIRDILNGKPKQ